MIKVISFDIGNTLVNNNNNISFYKQLFNETCIDEEVLKKKYRDHFLKRNISKQEFCDAVKLDKNKLDKIIYNSYKDENEFALFSDVKKTLVSLRQNYTLYAVSNKNYCNPYNLNYYGLDKYFDREIYSCELGHAKPEIGFFEKILEGESINNNEIIHIGDSYKSDYLGALNAGWSAVLLDRKNNCKDNFIRKVNTLSNLNRYIEEWK